MRLFAAPSDGRYGSPRGTDMAIQSERRRPEADHSPSLWEATAEVVAAGQQVMLDRVDLLRNEIVHDVRQFATGGALVVAANVVAAIGWLLLIAAFVALLTRWLPLDASLAVVGGLHIAVGIVLVILAVRSFREAGRDDARVEPMSFPEDGRG
jgi:hypothetical protein